MIEGWRDARVSGLDWRRVSGKYRWNDRNSFISMLYEDQKHGAKIARSRKNREEFAQILVGSFVGVLGHVCLNIE